MTRARQIAPLGLAYHAGPLHISRVDDLAAACGIYPLGRYGGYLRFRSLLGETFALPVTGAPRILDGAAVEELRTRLYALAARGRIAPLAPVTIPTPAPTRIAGVSRAERALFADALRRLRLRSLPGWQWNWNDAQRRGWLVDPFPRDHILAELWRERCAQLAPARPAVILRGGGLTADARHLRPASSADAGALGARIRAELVRRYAWVYPRRQIGPRYDAGDGWTVRVSHLSAGEAAILGGVFLDALCAVLCPALLMGANVAPGAPLALAAGAESEALP